MPRLPPLRSLTIPALLRFIHYRASKVGKEALIAVSDTGIGISATDQHRIFGEFEQIDNSSSRLHQGTGLGLALCKRLVELHGGTISVASKGSGKSSTFSFTIPWGLELSAADENED